MQESIDNFLVRISSRLSSSTPVSMHSPSRSSLIRRRSSRSSSSTPAKMHESSNNFSVRSSRLSSSTPVNMHSPSRSRRSPKSSSSTPAEIAGRNLSGPLALIGNEFQDDEEPVPLKIYKPNLLSEEKSTRRSTRFTTNKYKSASPVERKVKVLPPVSFPRRRSPRFSPAATGSFEEKSETTLDCIAIEWRNSCSKRRVYEDKTESMEGGVWKSPKKMKMCLRNCNGIVIENLEEKCLRRSPRLNSGSQIVENGNVKCEVLALPEPPSMEKLKSDKNTSQKTIRTRKIKSSIQKEEVKTLRSLRLIQDPERRDDENVTFELLALPEPPKPPSMMKRKDDSRMRVKAPLENGFKLDISDSAQLSEKCLRSRKIPITIVKAGNKSPELGNTKGRGTLSKDCDLLKTKQIKHISIPCFIGDPIPEDVARERWRWRYDLKSQRSKRQSLILNLGEEDEIYLNVECHYFQAKINGCIFNIGDCAFIKGEGRENHIGKILEFFETTDGEKYFRVQWFFRAEDTVMQDAATFHDKKRLFYSTLMNDNTLDCIIYKVNIIEASPALDLQLYSIQPSDFYYNMEYSVEYSTFRTLPSAQTSWVEISNTLTPLEFSSSKPYNEELALLDLYSGCGGMSSGLCLGAKLSGVQLVTRWAIDYHKSACDSLKLNHPETQVRHTTAEDFLDLLKEWEKLCKLYLPCDSEDMLPSRSDGEGKSESRKSSLNDVKKSNAEFEVSSLVDICYSDPSESGKHGLKFKVRWEGYGPTDDTWELIEDLSNCQGHIQDFVRSGLESKLLPLPGNVDVICGGPPCQGISGYNRYRNVDSPLTDERNQQIVVFMDIVKFLKPKYVLMENVTDILRFDKASLGRYALSRLVYMNYQARLGIMAAGCYGLPQFRLRAFLWGALPGEKLPQFPLPTHDVVVRYWPPPEFERNTVAYDEGQPRALEDAVVLRDAISDLPAVTSHETREQMNYERPPETNFQKYIRLSKEEMIGAAIYGVTDQKSPLLYDHRPYQISEDDYMRVCQIPHRKGANFRDLPGIIVNADNMVKRDPTKEPVILPSGKPLVQDYVFTFEKGKSKRPFARLWWDETVPTVVTFPSCHNQAALHPEQDRVLTLREYARLQGFPDYFRFCGTIKERYCQVGNAVAVPVARALGYALGMAFRKLSGDEPLMTLPPNFTYQRTPDGEIISNK